VVEASRLSGNILATFNTTFIALIPKTDNPTKFESFFPISLCNNIYKIISKIISRRLKEILSKQVSLKQFGFLEGRQIHEAIGVSQEGLHSVKTKNLKSMIAKVDLSKAFNHVSWLFLHLILIHLGFNLHFVAWVMACTSLVTFAVLINGLTSPFFKSSEVLGRDAHSLPLFFLLVVEGLSRALRAASTNGSFKGILIGSSCTVSFTFH
jgi:hypothetical protein